MTVDAVLGNPEVALRQVGNGDPVIRWGPTAADLYGRGEGVYLDFPGDALKPGCVYASDSTRYNPAGQSAVYAHIAQQANRPGYLAVQYWLYSYYNDWNDKHESDWEFVQVLFRASSVDEALAKGPTSVGYAQHTGGEESDWTSDKLERHGTHPVVYSSERSHASYVQPALFLGRGASEGFGCDNTQAPSTRLHPRVVLLPDQPTGSDDPFAWLAFNGRWGERQASPNNGPTGPLSKPRWSAPVDWQEGLRDTSFVVPGGSAAPPPVIETFCTVVGKGSVAVHQLHGQSAEGAVPPAALGLVLWFLLRRTSWRSCHHCPSSRDGGLARSRGRRCTLYGERPASPSLRSGCIAVPVAVLAALVTAVLDAPARGRRREHRRGRRWVGEPSAPQRGGRGGVLAADRAAGLGGRRLGRAHGPPGRVTPTRPLARGRRTRPEGPGPASFFPATVVIWLLSPDRRPGAGRRLAHGALSVPRAGHDARRPERPRSAAAQRRPGPAPVDPHRGHRGARLGCRQRRRGLGRAPAPGDLHRAAAVGRDARRRDVPGRAHAARRDGPDAAVRRRASRARRAGPAGRRPGAAPV